MAGYGLIIVSQNRASSPFEAFEAYLSCCPKLIKERKEQLNNQTNQGHRSTNQQKPKLVWTVSRRSSGLKIRPIYQSTRIFTYFSNLKSKKSSELKTIKKHQNTFRFFAFVRFVVCCGAHILT